MQSSISQKKIWIAWEKQRRSVELSKCFHCDLFLIIKNGLLRYPISIVKTFLIIRRENPDILFVQNPSMVLAIFATTFFRLFFKYYVVVDRHSNFLLTSKKRYFIFEAFFHFLSFVTIKYADLTIVTNDLLANVIDVLGGSAKVLPDKIPLMEPTNHSKLYGDKNILIISSFAGDEPIPEIVNASLELEEENVKFYFTGNFNKYSNVNLLKNNNIILTGFIPERDFVNLLFSVDAVMVLTTMEYTLLCGCYEAISASQILITSDTLTLRSLFDGAIFVKNTGHSIANGVRYAFENKQKNIKNISILKNNMSESWEDQFSEICGKIASGTIT